MLKKKLGLVLVIALAMAVPLVGCGGDEDTESEDTAATEEVAEETEEDAELEDLVVNDDMEEDIQDGKVVVTGTVTNEGDEDLTGVLVGGVAFDDDDNEIASQDTEELDLAAGESGTYTITFEDPDGLYSYCEVTPYADAK